MKTAYLFLASGFEETEAIGAVDVLRRGDVETIIVSITGETKVTGAHGIPVVADVLFQEADFGDADALVLPGGMPGSNNLNAFAPLKELLLKQYKQGKIVAAICAAPLVLGGLGLLKGRKATCYPGFEHSLEGAILSGEAVAVDLPLITGRGPGLVFDFALALVSALRGEAVAEEVAAGLLFPRPLAGS